MISQTPDPLVKAREYAFLLLKFRMRSEKEICLRLKKKGFEEGVIKEVLTFLKEKNFINDEDFTRVWIESRLKRRLGFFRIRQELKAKGIDQNIIERKERIFLKGYSEAEVVGKLIKERLEKLKRLKPEIKKRRLYAYLLRRGFSPERILEAINKIK